MRAALLIAVVLACAAATLAAGPWVYPTARSLVGRPLMGNKECAGLIQLLTRAPLTATWRPGTKVRGASGIAVGTAIATFLGTAANPYNKVGSRHTAFYMSQDSTGIQVVHQWNSAGTIQYGTLRYNNPKTHMNGNSYYVIMTGTQPSPPPPPPPQGGGSPPSPPSGGSLQLSVRNTLRQVFTRVDQKGISAMMGNIAVETGTFDYRTRQIGGNGYGLFQYDFMRRYYLQWLGSRTDSALLQITWARYIIYDNTAVMGAGYASRLKASLEGSGSVQQKTLDFMNIFERPGVPHSDRRVAAANADYARYGSGAQ